MSRTILCVVTAVALALLSLSVMAVRSHVMGDEVRYPHGPGTWKVTMVVQGRNQGDAKLLTLTPLDFGRQHVVRESCQSAEFLDAPPDTRHDAVPESRHPERRRILWKKRVGAADGSISTALRVLLPGGGTSRQRADVRVGTARCPRRRNPASISTWQRTAPAIRSPSGAAIDRRHGPAAGADRGAVPFRCRRHSPTSRTSAARRCNRPTVSRPAPATVLPKARLLIALLRSRSIPARLMTGLTLTKGRDQRAHYWVEAWVDQHWLPMCPVYHRFGEVPSTYLVFTLAKRRSSSGHHVSDIHYAFLGRKGRPGGADRERRPAAPHLPESVSLCVLSPNDQELVRFLLLVAGGRPDRLPVSQRDWPGELRHLRAGAARPSLPRVPQHAGPAGFRRIVLVGWLMRAGAELLSPAPSAADRVSAQSGRGCSDQSDAAGQLSQPVGDEICRYFSDGHPHRHDRAFLDAGD